MWYDYKCDSCQEMLEVDHGMNESPKIICPVCNNIMFKVVTGGSGVIFKSNKSRVSFGNTRSNWDWARKRPDPSEGHNLSKNDKEAREDKVLGGYVDRLKNNKPAV
jgi:putative FmdB family regulatory protein